MRSLRRSPARLRYFLINPRRSSRQSSLVNLENVNVTSALKCSISNHRADPETPSWMAKPEKSQIMLCNPFSGHSHRTFPRSPSSCVHGQQLHSTLSRLLGKLANFLVKNSQIKFTMTIQKPPSSAIKFPITMEGAPFVTFSSAPQQS